MVAYATEADLAGPPVWVADPPDDVERLLRSASFRVALACYLNPYDTPDPASAAPLRDATCAQVAFWLAAGVDPDTGGLDEGSVKRAEILDGKVEYDTAGQSTARIAAAGELCPEAVAILTAARIIYVPLPLFDECPTLPSWGLGGPADYAWPPLAEWPAWPFV